MLAPVSGRVHSSTDGAPDHVPGATSMDFSNPVGNSVVFRLETGTFLLIAHLKPGSVVVEAGDEVEEGDPVGACGNSGNTSEPHVHIHHQRQDPANRPLNFSEGLPLFFRDHDGPAMPQGGLRIEDGKVVFTGDEVQHRDPGTDSPPREAETALPEG